MMLKRFILDQKSHRTFYFYVYTPEHATQNITVNFDFSQRPNDNFIGTGAELQFFYPTYTLSGAIPITEQKTRSGKTYFRGTIYLDNDDVHEEDGVLTFAIKPGAGYAITDIEADTKAIINVTDDDSPSDKPLVNFVGVGGTPRFFGCIV